MVTPRLLRTLTIIFILLVIANVVAYAWVNSGSPDRAPEHPADGHAGERALNRSEVTVELKREWARSRDSMNHSGNQKQPMNADAFRHLYEYHFTINRKIWDRCVVPLPQELFTRKVDYSVGSVRNQVVHMLNIDERWFSGLRGATAARLHRPGGSTPTKDQIRAKWDQVEADMRAYLGDLRDDQLIDHPFGDAIQRSGRC